MSDRVEFQKVGNLTVGLVPLSRLVQRRTNYRQMSDRDYAALKTAISTFGFSTVIAVRLAADGEHYEVIDGHHRWRAAKELEMDSIPAALVNTDDDMADVAMLSFNVSGDVLPDVLMEMLREMSSRVASSVVEAHAGFSDGFIEEAIRAAEGAVSAVAPPKEPKARATPKKPTVDRIEPVPTITVLLTRQMARAIEAIRKDRSYDSSMSDADVLTAVMLDTAMGDA